MYGCVEFQSSMTGSTRGGPLQPPEDSAPLPAGSASSSSSSRSSCGGINPSDTDENPGESPRRRQDRSRKKMTPARPTSGQPIQLTPLWEHVVSAGLPIVAHATVSVCARVCMHTHFTLSNLNFLSEVLQFRPPIYFLSTHIQAIKINTIK